MMGEAMIVRRMGVGAASESGISASGSFSAWGSSVTVPGLIGAKHFCIFPDGRLDSVNASYLKTQVASLSWCDGVADLTCYCGYGEYGTADDGSYIITACDAYSVGYPDTTELTFDPTTGKLEISGYQIDGFGGTYRYRVFG